MKKYFALLLVLFVLTSCSSTVDLSYTQMALENEAFEVAIDMYEADAKKILKKQGEIVYNLDSGLLHHYNEDYSSSNEYLTIAEDSIDKYFTQSISANVGTYLVNDNVAEYQGEDFENIYINFFKALNYYHLGDYQASAVELNRMKEKQIGLEVKYDQELASYGNNEDLRTFKGNYFISSALAHYLSYLIDTARGNTNSAKLSKDLFVSTCTTLGEYYRSSSASMMDDVEYDNLNLFVFTDIVPQKEAQTEVFYVGSSYYSISYPTMPYVQDSIDNVIVSVDGEEYNLNLLEDISHIARLTFLPKQISAYNKSLLRSTTRAFTGEITKDIVSAMDTSDNQIISNLYSITSDLFGLFAESADVRGSHFLPSKAWVKSIDLEDGLYDIKIDFIAKSGKVIKSVEYNDFEVKKNRLNILETFGF